MTTEWYTAKEIAGLAGVPGTPQNVNSKAKRESWQSRQRQARGGGMEYHINSLPQTTQAAILARQKTGSKSTEKPASNDAKPTFDYDREALWKWADKKTQKLRERGRRKAELLGKCVKLVNEKRYSFAQASAIIAEHHDTTAASLKNWYYGVNGNPGARLFDPIDWPAALIPGYKGHGATAEIPPAAWEWFKGHYLVRRGPSIASSYRRVQDVAAENGWTLPCENTFRRRVKSDIPEYTRVLMREGEEAANGLYPSQKRDKRCFTAGEAVSGDGLKFDKLWIDWGDEIIATTTAWFWQDIYSGKLLAHRVAKTENTDVFRLATYDLTAICRPSYVQIDNTRVAANKAMTGGVDQRYRFKIVDGEAKGLLPLLGMDVHFTNPDHTISNAGVKPVERAFGIGGIHSEVASHPKFLDRGYSKATAIPIDEFRAVLAAEVARFNARPKRRSEVCGGVKSFDEAFNESFSQTQVIRLTDAQRRLLLLMPESVKVSRAGEITLKAGAMGAAKNRYRHRHLIELADSQVVAYYDPENLEADVAVYTLDGRHLCDAEHLGGTAFNDTAAAREWHKYKKRERKAHKIAAENEVRMTALERQAMYPDAQADTQIPEPGIVRGAFGAARMVDGNLVDSRSGQILHQTTDIGLSDEEKALQAEIAANLARCGDVVDLYDTDRKRYARAWHLERQHDISDEDARWLKIYQSGSEYQAMKEFHESFGITPERREAK